MPFTLPCVLSARVFVERLGYSEPGSAGWPGAGWRGVCKAGEASALVAGSSQSI